MAPLWKRPVSMAAPVPATTAHPSGLHCCSSCLFLIQTKLPITLIGTTQINCVAAAEKRLLPELWVNCWTHAARGLGATLEKWRRRENKKKEAKKNIWGANQVVIATLRGVVLADWAFGTGLQDFNSYNRWKSASFLVTGECFSFWFVKKLLVFIMLCFSDQGNNVCVTDIIFKALFLPSKHTHFAL